MAAYTKFNIFCFDMGQGSHNLAGAGHALKVMLTNTTPNADTNAVKTDLTDFAGGAGNGYTAGGIAVTKTWTRTTTTSTLNFTGTDPSWTATPAGWTGNFQWVILYNDGQTTAPVRPLIAYWDYGSPLNLGLNESFTVDFGASIFSIS